MAERRHLAGVYHCPGDKSISHRIALLSLLGEGECRVENYSPAEDTLASLEAVEQLGGRVERRQEALSVVGIGGGLKPEARIDCSNSGTTMRLLMGILAGLPGAFTLDGDTSLRKRPMERVAIPLRLMGASVTCHDGRPPLILKGGALKGTRYELPVPSAQLKSAILLAGVQANGSTEIIEPIRSRDHTERLLKLCGVPIEGDQGRWRVRAFKPVLPETYRIPGDVSSAAFFLCAALILPGSAVEGQRILLNDTRTGFLTVLQRMGARIRIQQHGDLPEPWGSIRSEYSGELVGCEIDEGEVPLLLDEIPMLALVASQCNGATIFHGVGELKVKESDRLEAISSQLGAMGAKIQAEDDKLVVHGPTKLRTPRVLRSFGDHRIAMMLRLACLLAGEGAVIEGEESVRISYPGFHATLKGLVQ